MGLPLSVARFQRGAGHPDSLKGSVDQAGKKGISLNALHRFGQTQPSQGFPVDSLPQFANTAEGGAKVDLLAGKPFIHCVGRDGRRTAALQGGQVVGWRALPGAAHPPGHVELGFLLCFVGPKADDLEGGQIVRSGLGGYGDQLDCAFFLWQQGQGLGDNQVLKLADPTVEKQLRAAQRQGEVARAGDNHIAKDLMINQKGQGFGAE